MKAKQYIKNVLVGIDQLLNAILFGNPGDTISFRAAVAKSKGKRWGCIACKLLNVIQKGHCEKTMVATDHQRLIWGEAVERGESPL